MRRAAKSIGHRRGSGRSRHTSSLSYCRSILRNFVGHINVVVVGDAVSLRINRGDQPAAACRTRCAFPAPGIIDLEPIMVRVVRRHVARLICGQASRSP